MKAAVELSPASSRHIGALDGLRGIAILLVMLHHFIPDPDSANGGLRLVLKALNTGWCGVDLFFVLSGFLITGILYDARGAGHYYRNFYVRRALRIFPLYYGVLALAFVILPGAGFGSWLGDLPAKQAWLWCYAANFRFLVDGGAFSLGPFNHFWSLAVEEHFYLLWPLVVGLAARGTLLRVCLGCAAAALAARAVCVVAGLPLTAPYTLTFCRMDSLALGGAAAVLIRAPGGARTVVSMARRIVLFGALPVVGLLMFCYRHQPLMITAGNSLLALFFTGAVVLAATAGRETLVGSFLNNPVLRTFGKYSYGLYVWHYLLSPQGFGANGAPWPVSTTLAERLATLLNSPALGIFLSLLVCLALALGAAMLSWHLCEKRILAWKRFWPLDGFRPQQPATPRAPASNFALQMESAS